MSPTDTAVQLAVILLGLGVAGSIVVSTLRTGISPMPSYGRALRGLVELMPFQRDGLIMELGSGWGTLAIALARRFPRARVRGYEVSLVPYLFSRMLARIYRLPNLELQRVDFMRENLGEASVLVCYLYPGAMRRLEPKLAAELEVGTPLISLAFALPGWEPETVSEVRDFWATRVYRYRTPAGLREELQAPRRRA